MLIASLEHDTDVLDLPASELSPNKTGIRAEAAQQKHGQGMPWQPSAFVS